MKFRLKADAIFEAEDIDDAMKKLGEHFISLSQDGGDTPDVFESGEISVSPIKAGG